MDQIEPSRPTLIDVIREMMKSQQTCVAKTTRTNRYFTSAEINNDELTVQGIAVLSDN